MKLLYIVLDGLGDRPVEALGGRTPLEAAETPNMDYLAEKGINGAMYTVGKGIAPESDAAVISILGYDPFRYHPGRGVVEAIGSDMAFEEGWLALRCNFATIGPHLEIIDRRCGRDLTSHEAEELSRAINDAVRLESHPATFEFKSTIGHRAVLVIRPKSGRLSANITNTDPAYAKVKGLGAAIAGGNRVLPCEPQDSSKEARASADLVNEFFRKSHEVLESHPVNLAREERGKLKANAILLRDASDSLPKLYDINKAFGRRFASLVDMPVERGIAKATGMGMIPLPPPTDDLEEDLRVRLGAMLNALPEYDCFYIHIKGPDLPGHDGDCELKKAVIEAIDAHFFAKLLPKVNISETIICITSDHSTPCSLRAHSDDPVPIVIAGGGIEGDSVKKFGETYCKAGKLGLLERGSELLPRLISLMGPGRAIKRP
ncbi:MAG: alkaline phosphatase family protein [Candidatus Bathyarchaeia archaeon]